MPLFAIKSNPFDDEYAKRWKGVGKRAEDAVLAAQEAATEVLMDEVLARGERVNAPASVLDGVRQLPDGRVGLPAGHPAQEEAHVLEFGDLEHPPTGIMRSAERHARAEAEAVFSEVLEEELGL